MRGEHGFRGTARAIRIVELFDDRLGDGHAVERAGAATDFIEHDNIHQLSQELRLSGATEKTDWLVGAFASRDQVNLTYVGGLQELFNTTSLSFSNQV